MHIALDPNAWHGKASEGIWVRRVGGDIYKVDNIPFYATGIGCGDEVIARAIDGRLVFQRVQHHSGHSTYRVIFKKEMRGTSKVTEFLNRVKNFGCSYEGLDGWLFAIDVPPTGDIHQLYHWLETGEVRGDWEFEEGFYGTRP